MSQQVLPKDIAEFGPHYCKIKHNAVIFPGRGRSERKLFLTRQHVVSISHGDYAEIKSVYIRGTSSFG
jgi:hypothetical protein